MQAQILSLCPLASQLSAMLHSIYGYLIFVRKKRDVALHGFVFSYNFFTRMAPLDYGNRFLLPAMFMLGRLNIAILTLPALHVLGGLDGNTVPDRVGLVLIWESLHGIHDQGKDKDGSSELHWKRRGFVCLRLFA